MTRTALAAPVLAPVLALVVPLALGGCSGDSGGSDGSGGSGGSGSSGGSAAASTGFPEIRAGLVELYAGDHAGERDTTHGECFADALLADVPVADLEAAGVVVDGAVAPTSPTLDRDLAEQWVEAMLGCMDFIDESARAQVAFTKGKVDWQQYAACLRGELDETAVRAAVVGTLMGDWDSPDVAALTQAQAECSTAANPG